MKTISWFSAGCSSAVATKLLIKEIDEIIYTHIEDQHPDTMRFVKDCEQWFGKLIQILYPRYKNVDTACRMASYIAGVKGAGCTSRLKIATRKEWEKTQTEELCYVWGMDINEKHRVERIPNSMPNQSHRFPLIEQGLTKESVHQILTASGIKRPAMYDLGYNNNNCIGCVKGGKGYWNKIRRDFPDVFKTRSILEREIGHSCINGIYLDELPESKGWEPVEIDGDCGIMCELIKI